MSNGDTRRFLAAFLRHPTRVGAIAPSSPQLAAKMLEGIDLQPDRCIIEFGPGTGPFTQAIADHLKTPTQYLGIERDEQLITLLRERFPEMQFVEGSAEKAGDYHADAKLPPVQAVISGLPFASLPPAVQDGVIDAIVALLPPGGVFRTFQYTHAYALPTAIRFRKRMNAIFGPCSLSGPVMRNLPPANVLTWRIPES